MKILAIPGSLRASSSNTAMLRAAAALAPSTIEFTLFDGIGNLPHFNPDLDGETVSPLVTDYRTALCNADAAICSAYQAIASSCVGGAISTLAWSLTFKASRTLTARSWVIPNTHCAHCAM